MLASVFSSCSDGILHTHSYEKTEILREAGCTKGGKIIRKCTSCGLGDKYTTAPRGHILSDWTDNGDGEYIKTCTVCGVEVAREKIYTEYSSGLELKRGVKSTSYTVVGIGSCTDKVIVIPPDVDGMPISDIGDYAFAGCNNIKAVIIPDTVTRIGVQAFGGTSVEKIFIPDSVKYIYDGAFARCRELKELILPNALTVLADGVFANTASLYELILPSSLTVLGSLDRSSFRRISIPSGITRLPDKAFLDCANLEEILLPTDLKEIGDEAFAGCSSLIGAILPDSVEVLGTDAFRGCVALEFVSVPREVKSLSEGLFEGCVSLVNIYLHSEVRYISAT
ncbi:MAG: leucine-rich repeat domain-containing protein, partial [Clostridia bacterium]|nr:leucine-rich repeat domain-containing protein [Clostridia bacterium]